MKFFKQTITAALALGLLSVGALAGEQKDEPKKPPKPPTQIEQPEKRPPAPRNDNRGGNSGRGNDNRPPKPNS